MIQTKNEIIGDIHVEIITKIVCDYCFKEINSDCINNLMYAIYDNPKLVDWVTVSCQFYDVNSNGLVTLVGEACFGCYEKGLVV